MSPNKKPGAGWCWLGLLSRWVSAPGSRVFPTCLCCWLPVLPSSPRASRPLAARLNIHGQPRTTFLLCLFLRSAPQRLPLTPHTSTWVHAHPEPLPGRGLGGATGLAAFTPALGSGALRTLQGRGGMRGRPAAVVPPAVTCAQCGVEGLGRRFSKHSPGTSRVSTTWEPVRPASRPHPRPSLIRSSRGGACELLSQALLGILMWLKSRLGCHWSRMRHLREHISKSTFG